MACFSTVCDTVIILPVWLVEVLFLQVLDYSSAKLILKNILKGSYNLDFWGTGLD